MSVSSGAIASGRVFCNGTAPTTLTTTYTAPTYSANVTTPSATAYIKEIVLCNVSGSSATIIVTAGGPSIVNTLTIAGYDTKILTGLNTMLSSGATIQIQASAANVINYIISGVEVQ